MRTWERKKGISVEIGTVEARDAAHGPEDVRLDEGVLGHAHDDEGAVGAQVLERVVVGSRRARGDNGSLWTLNISSRFDNSEGRRTHVRSLSSGVLLDELVRLGVLEVDELLGAEAGTELLLLLASVDGEHAETQRGGVLDREVSKSSAGTRDLRTDASGG